MFTYLNKILTNSRRVMSRESGQVAVILILVVAAALIFYAVSLNFGRMSQTKVAVTVASNTGASLLASYMASKAHALYKIALDGDRKVCGWTGVMAAILVIIAIVIILVTWGTGTHLALAIIAMALAFISLIVQMAYIQPGLTSMWNEIIWHTMEERDAFLEQGIQTALVSAVSDNVLVPDIHDNDADRVWGFDGMTPLDEISRFGFYYGLRLGAIKTLDVDVDDFYDALEDFLKKTTIPGDNWGIYDGTGPKCDPFAANSECKPCCLHWSYWTPKMGCADNVSGGPGSGDPPYVPHPADVAVWQATCEANSPYGSNYPWVYDAFRENPLNNAPPDPDPFISFREALGRDDEHREFRKNPDDDLLTPVYDGPNGIQASMAGDGFRMEDTTGYHAADNRAGIFDFFYKIADWGVDLQSLTTGDSFNPHCNWCDATYSGTTCDPTATYSPEFSQLDLSVVNDPGDLTYNTTFCVDGTNPITGNPPLAVDLVRLPDPSDLTIPWASGIGKIIADADQCAQNALGDPDIGFWKKGADRFCDSDDWPYFAQCPKHGVCAMAGGEGVEIDVDCGCGQTTDTKTLPESPESWPDDPLDDLVYGLNDFIIWAKAFLRKSPDNLKKDFKKWYPSAASWIEEGTDSGAVDDRKNCLGKKCCFICDADGKDGELWVWYKKIQEMRIRLGAWRDTSFAGSACREVWCVPPDYTESPPYFSCTSSFQTPPPPGEEATFDSNGNSIRGDIEDIVACINWNANDTVTYDNTITYSHPTMAATGNADKFKACIDECNAGGFGMAEKCANLPRSLVPGVDTRLPKQSDLAQMQGCLNQMNNCATSNPNPVCQGMSPAYFTGDPATTDFQADVCPTWGPTNIWYQEIIAALSDVCDPAGWISGIIQSEPEARNQVAKFRQRYNFLSKRLEEMDDVIKILGDAGNQFYGFLTCDDNNVDFIADGPACELIRQRILVRDDETGLPYHAIYGWQSESDAGSRWHVVRADARIPERCDRACNWAQTPTGDPSWPYVDSDLNDSQTRRCYELKGTSGVVKMRVSRFDEAGTFGTLLFPNAVEIWRPTFSRGDRPVADASGIAGACVTSMVPNPGNITANPGDYYYGAFMLNERADNPGCWDLANDLLVSGVTSETCAQYYFAQEGFGWSVKDLGMRFKFVPCKDF